MKSVWDATVREELLGRLAQLKPDSRPRWGNMNAAQMVGHLADPLLGAMGEMKVTAKSGPLSNPVLRYLIIYILPWPKGAPTAPEFIHAGPEELQTNVAKLRPVLERYAAHAAKGGLRPHPAFGDISTKDWGCLTYRHLDHHLSQFGL